jgi:hypothetical protein
MEVKLVFVGFTNTVLMARDAAGQSKSFGVHVFLLRATNTGSVPVQLWAAAKPADFNDPNFARPNASGLHPVLKPGESVAVTATPPGGESRWRTKFMYQRHALTDQLYAKAWNTGSRALQAMMSRLLSSPKEGWAESGWITNRPPQRLQTGTNMIQSAPPRRRYHITAPPTPMHFDLTGDLHPEATVAKKA